MRLLSRNMFTILLPIFFNGCGPVNQMVKDGAITANISGLEQDTSQLPSLVYIRPGAPTLADYERFIIDAVQINYTDQNMKDLDPEKIGEMQQYLRNAMIYELREAGYEVGSRSQSGTLRISLSVSNVKAQTGGGAANVGAIVAGAAVGLPGIYSVSVGEVTVEAVLREAVSNRVDAVVLANSRGSRVFKAEPWSTWADVTRSFDNWAKGVREAVDVAHGR